MLQSHESFWLRQGCLLGHTAGALTTLLPIRPTCERQVSHGLEYACRYSFSSLMQTRLKPSVRSFSLLADSAISSTCCKRSISNHSLIGSALRNCFPFAHAAQQSALLEQTCAYCLGDPLGRKYKLLPDSVSRSQGRIIGLRGGSRPSRLPFCRTDKRCAICMDPLHNHRDL